MTKQECAIVMAYTGKCMLAGDDLGIYYKYIAELLCGPVYTHELADIEVVEEIKEKAKPDFIKLCREAKD